MSAKAAKPATPPPAPVKAAKPAPPPKPVAKRTSAAPKKAPAAPTGPVTPEVARQHFRELLEAKQQRDKQGPSYPAPNAFTGRPHEGTASPAPANEPSETAPDVEATYGEGEFKHGRGNQGMRGQN
ncbi:MAG TPA: hypothetical protein VFV97_02635 [Rhodanobacteraceae bacterium]|nr:hypothetical protein [Rhodanobacteraceae bacterium]